jgi:serine O-acetyltransferase
MPYHGTEPFWSIVFEEAKVFAEKDNVRLLTVIYLLFMDCGFLLNFCYRIAHRLHERHRGHITAVLLPKVIMQFARVITGSSISYGARIGKRFKIGYGSDIVIGEHAEIGDDVFMFNGVTLGSTIPNLPEVKQPRIGNNVLIGSGAKLLGGIRIGDNVKIGANSVVLKSFDSDVSIAGVPAKVVSTHGSTIA